MSHRLRINVFKIILIIGLIPLSLYFLLYRSDKITQLNLQISGTVSQSMQEQIYTPMANFLYGFVNKYSTQIDHSQHSNSKNDFIKDMKANIMTIENAKLKSDLNFINNIKEKYVATKVLHKLYNARGSYAVIGAGETSNIKIGNPVINAHGLIGRVVAINDKFAKIMLLDNTNLSISTVSQKSNVYCILRSQNSKNNSLNISNIDDNNKLKAEELLVTVDGKSISYGIPVATTIRNANAELVAKPLANLEQLDTVAVLIYEDDAIVD